MRIFVAGANRAIGSQLVPQLIEAGHEVIGTHRSPSHSERLRPFGAKSVALDLLDPAAVSKALREAEPEAVIYPSWREGFPATYT